MGKVNDVGLLRTGCLNGIIQVSTSPRSLNLLLTPSEPSQCQPQETKIPHEQQTPGERREGEREVTLNENDGVRDRVKGLMTCFSSSFLLCILHSILNLSLSLSLHVSHLYLYMYVFTLYSLYQLDT